MSDLRIGIVHYPGAQLSAAMGLADLFGIAGEIADRADRGAPRLSTRVIESPADDRTLSPGGSDARCDVLILPPSLHAPITADAAAPLADWLRERHAAGVVIASVCGGSFLLAETGLLSGRAATTHWVYADAFRQRFPDVILDLDRLVIDGGDILSAGGLMSWADLGLKLVDRYLGPVRRVSTSSTISPGPQPCRSISRSNGASIPIWPWICSCAP
ncbi:DJ-1/PfpI family protein [Wenxinia saemankumensis]|nr:DJ-1/PfpI family protein [Wenxinia saemankumensis]